MTDYPKVHGELETIEKIKQGFSISRFGDGELKCMDKTDGYVREPHNPSLSKELRRALTVTIDRHIVGVPTMDVKGSKYRSIEPTTGKAVGWFRHKERFNRFLDHDREYYSAFISRPDCGKWMLNVDYAKALQSIWIGKQVAVIGSESDNKMYKAVKFTNDDALFIECPFREAYSQIDRLEQAALDSGREMILISAGVTATVLAYRLAPKVQAIDIGSVGGFLCKMLGAEKWH